MIISACITLHFFNGTGLFYSHPFVEQTYYTLDTEAINFYEINTKISFLARIAGGYYLGKFADRYGFIKTMQFICLLYILAGLFLTFFDESNIFKNEILLCCVHGLLSFLRWSSFILPAIYIFQHYKKLDRPKHSAFMWTVALLGMMVANLCVSIFTNATHIDWCIAYIMSGILTLVAYSCITTSSEFKPKKVIEESIIQKQAIFLAFLLAGTCGAGITYQYYFIEHYVREVMILKVPGQQVIYSPFWVALLFTFLPAAHITKNLKTVKIIQISLLGIALSVSLLYMFPSSSYLILFIHQITFAIFFGLFLSPALRFIYRLLQGYNSYFYMNYIFCLGFSCFTLFGSYLAELSFLSIPLQGASLIALLMTACLWTDYHYGLSQKSIKYKQVTL